MDLINPIPGHLKIVNQEIIKELVITSPQGRVILHIKPNTFTTLIILGKGNAPTGSYYIKITTIKGVSTYKILITV